MNSCYSVLSVLVPIKNLDGQVLGEYGPSRLHKWINNEGYVDSFLINAARVSLLLLSRGSCSDCEAGRIKEVEGGQLLAAMKIDDKIEKASEVRTPWASWPQSWGPAESAGVHFIYWSAQWEGGVLQVSLCQRETGCKHAYPWKTAVWFLGHSYSLSWYTCSSWRSLYCLEGAYHILYIGFIYKSFFTLIIFSTSTSLCWKLLFLGPFCYIHV